MVKYIYIFIERDWNSFLHRYRNILPKCACVVDKAVCVFVQCCQIFSSKHCPCGSNMSLCVKELGVWREWNGCVLQGHWRSCVCYSFSIFKSEANSSMKCENLYENCCLFFLQIRQSIESHYENTQMFVKSVWILFLRWRFTDYV